jgi:hypothetical protein
MARKYSSISVETTLASGISSSATTMTVASSTSSLLMGGVSLTTGNVDKFTVAIDPDTVNEEIVYVTGVSSDTLTIVRAQAGSGAIAHSGGATIKHVLTSDDLNYFNTSIDAAVSLTGTQTLTNKTLTSPTINSGTISSATLTTPVISTISNTGTITLPTSTDTLVGRATTDTLTNKTLTAPIIALSVNAQTGTTYTTVASDAGSIITASNVSPITVSIPTNASVPYAIGSQINIIATNAGQVTISAVTSGTTTILSTAGTPASPKLRTRYSSATALKVGTDLWYVVGDIV